MTVTFPRTDFLSFAEVSPDTPPFTLLLRQEASRTAGGVTLVKDLGPALWALSILTTVERRRDAHPFLAWLHSLQGGVGTFLMNDETRRYPRLDPTGSLSASVLVNASSLGQISLKGLPEGYTLSPGDMLSFQYGVGGVGWALHEVSEAAVANSSGVTPTFAVQPPIRAGSAVADAAVSLKSARGEFRLTSFTSSPRDKTLLEFQVNAVQVVR